MTGKLASHCPRKALKSFLFLDTIDSQKQKAEGQQESCAEQLQIYFCYIHAMSAEFFLKNSEMNIC